MRRHLGKSIYLLMRTIGAGHLFVSILLTTLARSHLNLSDYWETRASGVITDPPKDRSP